MTMICVTRKNVFNSRGGTGYYKLVVFGFCLLALQPLEAVGPSAGETVNQKISHKLEYDHTLEGKKTIIMNQVHSFTSNTKRVLEKKTEAELKKLITEGGELFGNIFVAEHNKIEIKTQLSIIHKILEEVKTRKAGGIAIELKKKIQTLREQIQKKERDINFKKSMKRSVTELEKQLEYLRNNMIETRNMYNEVMGKSHNSTPVKENPVSKGLTMQQYIEHINRVTGQAPLTKPDGCLGKLGGDTPYVRKIVDYQEEKRIELRGKISNREFMIKLKENTMKTKEAEVLKQMHAMEYSRNSKAALAAITKITADINKLGEEKIKLEKELESLNKELKDV